MGAKATRAPSIGRTLSAAVAVLAVAAGWMAPPAAAAPAARPAHGWSTEHRWSARNDWEPTIAAAPTSPWLYQMTVQFGGAKQCRRHMNQCVVFRSSWNRGRTWRKPIVMPRRMCPPGAGCRAAAWQNNPVLAVSSSGAIFAAWMNESDVVFAKSRNHGRTWIDFHDFRRAFGGKFTDKPWIAISRTGKNAYVAFNSNDSFISGSHSFGRHWTSPVGTNADTRHWFADGGAVAPDGNVYFAESAESSNATGPVRLAVISSTDRGATWTTRFVARSKQQPPCPQPTCASDFYAPQISIAVDPVGTILAAYVASTTPTAAMTLFAITSANGTSWSAPAILGTRATFVGSSFPQVVAGPGPGEFGVAWEDDGGGARAWNIRYRATVDYGVTWGRTVRVSNRSRGARYKSGAGFRFPYGNYFGMTLGSRGVTYLTWSEGRSYEGPGNTWWARNSWFPRS